MKDKIALLMEETGCDAGQAELALEMCGYQVEAAIKTIARLLKDIVVLKARFRHGPDRFGLFLAVANAKSGALLRSRAVLSYNPAVYAVSLERSWFDFEKFLYSCRLWEGSLPGESLDLERWLSSHFRHRRSVEKLKDQFEQALSLEIEGILKPLLSASSLKLELKKEILDLGQFQSLRNDLEKSTFGRRPRSLPRSEELLVLKVVLEENPQGTAAPALRSGDVVSAQIVDTRDIAQYLAKLFGGHSEKGPLPIAVPVEAIERVAPSGVLIRVRFSVGVCGDAVVPVESRLIAARKTQDGEYPSWWHKLFKA
ncbi:MAG: hypothetical protein A3J74_02000 [Elusimicrobia bacterium RIFCSPHIGHO2_02_FULL_57_9]|nr:MAG: hypothetical protein A3J74_02000 [Elusimicrobia bacterium RIFCSPHIGHO2_02_FULL_57_9]